MIHGGKQEFARSPVLVEFCYLGNPPHFQESSPNFVLEAHSVNDLYWGFFIGVYWCTLRLFFVFCFCFPYSSWLVLLPLELALGLVRYLIFSLFFFRFCILFFLFLSVLCSLFPLWVLLTRSCLCLLV